MIEYVRNLLVSRGINENLSLMLAKTAAAIGIIALSCLAHIITEKFLLKALKHYISKSKAKWDDVFLENKVLDMLSHVPPVMVIHALAPVFPTYQGWIQRIAFSYIIFVSAVTLSRLLDAVDVIYRQLEISKTRPIKGYLQVVKIFMSITAAVVIISIIIDRSPWILLSGIGAATAILILIFQNSILGLVASIQLSTNNMLRIGDWIEMPSNGADGEVIDISLHTVKVQNWDKTIVTIPTHEMISKSFKNWRGMREAGGRRIKRSIYIDVTSIKFCDEEMLNKYKKIQYIEEYIKRKEEEIKRYNEERGIDDSASIVNGRHLTNIGTFRAYVDQYLKNHPRLNRNMISMVRQLQPTEHGLPLEIYAFTDVTAWTEYEAIQSDIFDHILAAIPEFDLRLFQEPTGYDLRRMGM